MAEVIGIRFKDVGKIYYFDPDGEKLEKGDYVIVETTRGIEIGEVAMENREVSDDQVVKPLKMLIRRATKEDRETEQKNRQKEKEAFQICLTKIEAHGLEMKLVDVECTFDGSKILFYFTADGRVDFRALVKDLAGVFRTRIELRQIGVRDEAKMLGGLGVCGRPFCCNTFLGDFQPVSIKMAKEQGLSLNPTKISGSTMLSTMLTMATPTLTHMLMIAHFSMALDLMGVFSWFIAYIMMPTIGTKKLSTFIPVSGTSGSGGG